jgi:hypothetical protein
MLAARNQIFIAGGLLLGSFLSPLSLSTASGQAAVPPARGGVASVTNTKPLDPLVAMSVPAGMVIDSMGWTVFRRSADTRVIYVSSSRGNDSNDGLRETRPKKTLEAAYALLRDGYPDHMLLKKGDTWEAGLPPLSKSGRSQSEKMLIGTWGTGSRRPRLNTGTGGGVSRGGGSVADVSHVAIVGLHFTPHRRTASDVPLGICFIGQGNDLLFEGNLVAGYANNMNFDGYDRTLSNVTLRRNVIVDAWATTTFSQGIYAHKINGMVIAENVLDHNGWSSTIAGAPATVFNHTMYLKQNVTGLEVIGNVVCRGSADGIQIRGSGIARGNVAIANPIGITLGHVETPPNTMVAIADSNVVFDSGNISGQPRGFAFMACNLSEARFVNNFVIGNTSGAGPMAKSWIIEQSQQGVRRLVLENNIIDGWGGPIELQGSSTILPEIVLRNNSFVDRSGGATIIDHCDSSTMASVRSERNQFWTSAPATGWFKATGVPLGFTDWKRQTRDTGSTALVAPAAALPTLEGFARSRRLPSATRDGFYAALRKQAPGAWRKDMTAPAIASYLRSGK